MLEISDLDINPAASPGVCLLCQGPIMVGVDVASLAGQPVHVEPCMVKSLRSGSGDPGWDAAFRGLIPTRFKPTAWMKGGRLRLMAPYFKPAFDALKEIPGRNYHPDPKPHWSFPQDATPDVLEIARAWPDLAVDKQVSGYRRASGKAKIEVVRGRVHLRFPFDPKATAALKAVPGSRWSDKHSAWTWPVEAMDEVLAVAQVVIKSLRVDGSMLRQADREETASSMAVAITSDEVITYPGAGTLRGYQAAGLRFLQARQGVGLLADDMGLGKTIQALAYARERGVGDGPRMLVVAPAAVRVNWAREAVKWMGLTPHQILLCGLSRPRRNPPPFLFMSKPGSIPDSVALAIVNYEILGRWAAAFAARRFDVVTFDEAHYLQNSKAARSRHARYLCHGIRSLHQLEQWMPAGWEIHNHDSGGMQIRKTETRQDPDTGEEGVAIVHETPPARVNVYEPPVALNSAISEARSLDKKVPDLDLAYRGIPEIIETTGTPILNRPDGLWHLLHLLDPQAWGGKTGGYKAFTRRYMGGHVNYMGKWALGTSATNPEELHRRLLGTYMARRRKVDVLTELPPHSVHQVQLEPTSTEMRPYHDLTDTIAGLRQEYEAIKARRAMGEDVDVIGEIQDLLGELLGKAAQLQRVLGTCKLPATLRWLKQLLDAQEPVVIFAWHKDVQTGLLDGLRAMKVPTVHILSSDSAMNRVAAIDSFQGGTAQAIVCSIKAANAGITLHRAAHTVHVERAWNPSENTQAEARTHRMGQTRACFGWYLNVPGSFDERMEEVNAIKQRDQNLVLDGQVFKHDGSRITQRALLADFIGLHPSDLDAFNG